MANIVGEPFDKYVSKQILDRQKIHGQGNNSNRDNLTLSYLNSRTSWIKLSSGVSIFDRERLDRIGLNNHPEFAGPDGTYTGLSNFFILFNGTSDNAGTPYGGIDIINGKPHQDIGQSILNKVAYGIGGTEFGLRPMPGITSCETKFRNRGSIREGTINIKVYNRTQLEIINLLYLRLGFPMLLEWGHSLIVNTDGKIDTKPNFSISKKFLGLSYKTDNDVLSALEKQRELSAGNYDGMYGQVVNFDWTFNKDGSYDVTLKLISIGAVIESLKANVYIKDNNAPQESSPTDQKLPPPENDQDWITSSKYSSTIGNYFFEFYKRISTKSPESKDKEGIRYSKIEDLVFIRNGTDKDFIYISELNKYYIRLGAFWSLLQQIVPITDQEPLIYFYPSGVEDNPAYTEEFQISSDPNICLIGNFNIKLPYITGNPTYNILPQLPPFKDDYDDVLKGKIENIYINTTFILQSLTNNKDENGDVKLYDFIQGILDSLNTALGGVNKLTLIINENNKNAKIIDETPIKGWPKQPKPESESALFDVFGYHQNNTSAGFIKEFSLKTEITNNLNTLLTIGATANKSVVGEDATAFSKWNKGLVPIIGQKVSYPNDDSKQLTPSQAIVKFQKDNAQMINLYKEWIANQEILGPNNSSSVNIGGLSKPFTKINKTNLSDYTEIVKNFINFNTEYNLRSPFNQGKVTSTSSRGFLPINLSLTMDGLSGIKIYQQIRVGTAYLPAEYPTTLKFLIKGVTNKVDSSGWTTSIETVSVPVIDFVNGGENPSLGTTSPITTKLPPSAVNRAKSRNYETAYPELPFTEPPPPSDLLPYEKAVKYLKSKYGNDLGKAVFAILFAEAAKSGNAFRSAGGHNYAGVQTDNDRWGAKGIIGQYSRIDSGGARRSFAIFSSDESFLDFMASRVKAKKFSGVNGDAWTTTYINFWWSPKEKKQYVKGTQKYESKLAIFNTASNKFNSLA
jgi:hypothetical protein